MYYRRKVLLALLQSFNNSLEKIRLQKLLFLLSRFQKENSYHFVPYKYGSYSFQSVSDIQTLGKYNIVKIEEKQVTHISGIDYLSQLKSSDRLAIQELKRSYGQKSSEELTKSTYLSHPYYAINSLIARKILNEAQYQKVLDAKPLKTKTTLLTIGYEGITLEEYLNKLIRNDVKLLCDVRHNAQSMKYGFSKTQLKSGCESVGIAYTHIPEVGIQSNQRQELHSQQDYDKLFETYKFTVIKESIDSQKNILKLLLQYKRIALTCFEANICQCHRKPLAEAITKLEGWQYELKHI